MEPTEKLEKPNPGCVRMTVILIQKPEGWGHFSCASHGHPTSITRGIRLGELDIIWY
jgi:hypothetical protein